MYGACVHEAAHGVVGEALGFPVREMAITRSDSNVWSGWSRFDLGHGAADAGESGPPRICATAVLTLADAERQAIAAAVRKALGSDERVVNYLAVSLAGRLASLKMPSGFDTCGVDDAAAETLILGAFDDVAARRTLDRARMIAARVLSEQWTTVQHVALLLVARERLSGDEVRAIVEAEREAHNGTASVASGRLKWN